jgi:hypothetical protein
LVAVFSLEYIYLLTVNTCFVTICDIILLRWVPTQIKACDSCSVSL